MVGVYLQWLSQQVTGWHAQGQLPAGYYISSQDRPKGSTDSRRYPDSSKRDLSLSSLVMPSANVDNVPALDGVAGSWRLQCLIIIKTSRQFMVIWRDILCILKLRITYVSCGYVIHFLYLDILKYQIKENWSIFMPDLMDPEWIQSRQDHLNRDWKW